MPDTVAPRPPDRPPAGTGTHARIALAPELDHPHAKLIQTSPPSPSRPFISLPLLVLLAPPRSGSMRPKPKRSRDLGPPARQVQARLRSCGPRPSSSCLDFSRARSLACVVDAGGFGTWIFDRMRSLVDGGAGVAPW